MKYEENKKSRGSKEIFKMEIVVDNKHSVEEGTWIVSNPNKTSCSEGSPNFDDEANLGVECEGELISTLDVFKRSRKENKERK